MALSNLRNFSFIGSGGTTILFPARAPPSAFLIITNVTGVTISGLTIKAERSPSTLVQVQSVSSDGFSARFDPGTYPFLHDDGTPISFTKRTGYLYGAIDPEMLVPMPPNLWVSLKSQAAHGAIALTSNTTLRVAATGVPKAMEGHLLLLEHSREFNAINISYSTNVVLSHVNHLDAPGCAMWLTRCINVSLSHYNIIAADAPYPLATIPAGVDPLSLRAMSSTSGGFNFWECSGTLVIESCRAERMGDDTFASNMAISRSSASRRTGR